MARGLEMIAQGGGGVGGGRNHFAVGWVSFHFLEQHKSRTSGRMDGDLGRGGGTGTWETIARGGRVQSFFFMFQKLKIMGCAQTSFLGPRRGIKGVWGER